MKRVAIALAVVAASSGAAPGIAQPSSVARSAGAAIDETRLVWARPGLDLAATIYRPKTSAKPLPVLIDVHGGAWGAGDHTGDRLYCAELAASGLIVISIDFRQSPTFKHPAGSADVAAAVRYARLNAKSLGADPDAIGLIGSSSGGHLALLAALLPDAPQHKGTPVLGPDGAYAVHDDITAKVNYVVAMWPVSDPAARYRYAKRAGLTRLVELTELYFADERAQWDASIPRIVTSGEAKVLPPILVIQPGNDANIPQDMTFDLLRAWQARGGKLDYAFYPGEPHAFGHRASAATADLIAAIGAFIARQNAS